MPPDRETISPPLQRVLVATDFSAGGEAAVARALLLPLARGAKITLLHVMPASLGAGNQREVAAVAKRVMRRAGGRRVAVEVAVGPAAESIARAAARIKAELIVLGRHGGGRLRTLLIGSTAEGVIRRSDVPVLVVARKPASAYRHLLIAWDAEGAARSAFDTARSLAAPRRITVLHCSESPLPPETGYMGLTTEIAVERRRTVIEIRRELRKLAASRPAGEPAWSVLVRLAEPRRSIPDEARRLHCDLIVTGTHTRRGLARALLGSVAEGILRASKRDVLIVRPRTKGSR